MAIIKAKSDVKQRIKQEHERELFVGEEAQNRLAAILADSPTIEKLAGTEWEVRALRFGTQYLIVKEVSDIKALEKATYDNVLIELASTIPAVCRCVTFVLLNDKNKIYQNGDQNAGFSKLFKRTYDTVLWNANRDDLARLLLDCLQMVDDSFFMEALGMLQIFRARVTEKKRTRIKIAGQK